MIKSKKFRIVFLYLFVFVMCIGASFAWYVWQGSSVAVNVNFSGLDPYLNFDTTSVDTGSQTITPSSSYSGGVHNDITFKKKEEGNNLNVYGHVYVKVSSADSDIFKSSAVKWTLVSVTNNTETVISTGNFVGEAVNNEIPANINFPVINSNVNTTYRVYVWVDSSVSQNVNISNKNINVTTYASATTENTINENYIREIDYNSSNITKLVLYSSKYNINGYKVTNTNTQPSSWTTVTGSAATNEAGYLATVTSNINISSYSTVYVWMKNTNGDIAVKSFTKGSSSSIITLNGNGATTNSNPTQLTATYEESTLSPSTITLPQKKYTVTYDANGTGVTMPSAGTVTYPFNGWYTATSGGSKLLSESTTPALQANVTVSDVQYTGTGGKWLKAGDVTVYARWGNAQAITLGTISKTGYTCSWNTEDDGSGTSYTSGQTGFTTSQNITLYADCDAIDYTITLKTGTGVSSLTASGWTGTGGTTLTKTYHVGDTINLSGITVTNATGYSGSTWSKTSGSGTLSGTTFTVGAGSATLTVSSSLTNYTITLKAGTGVSTLTASGWTSSPAATITKTYHYNDSIDLSGIAVTNTTGYSGSTWSKTSGSGTLSGTTFTVGTGNATLTATGTLNTAKVTIYKDGSKWTTSNPGINVALYQSGTSKYAYSAGTKSSDKSEVTWSTVTAGTYDIYMSKDSNHLTDLIDSGVDLIVTSDADKTVNLYTLTMSLTNTTVTVNGSNISNGSTVVVAGGTTSASNNYAHTIVATAPTGYTFGSWSSSSGSTTITNTGTASTTLKAAAASTITATSSQNNYTITLKAGTGVSTLTASGWTETGGRTLIKSYTYGATVDLTGISVNNSTGYSGATWTKSSGSGTLSGTTFTVGEGDATLTVSGTLTDYTITIKATSGVTSLTATGWTGSGGATLTRTYHYQDRIDLNEITVSNSIGYSGATWSMTSGSGYFYDPTTFEVGAGNATLGVGASLANYTITLKAGTGVSTLTASGWTGSPGATLTKTYHMGEKITLSGITVANVAGYSGANWAVTSGSGSISSGTYTVGVGDATLTATGTLNTAKVTIYKDGSKWTTSNPGINVALYQSGTSKYAYSAGTKSSDKSEVTWSAVTSGTYDIYMSKDSNHLTDLIDSGVDLTVTSDSSKTVNLYTLTMSLTNTTVTVNGSNISNGSTVVVAGGTTSASNNYAHTIVATAPTGYTFGSWSSSSGSTTITNTGTASTTLKAAAASTITATSSQNNYTITLTSGTGVSTLTASGWTSSPAATITKSYHYNDTIDLSGITVTNSTGYHGSTWSKTSGSGTLSGTTFTVGTGAATLTVTGTINTYNISYALNSGTASTSCATGANPTSATYNSDIRICNPTRSGYAFTGWSATVGANAKTGASSANSTWNGTKTKNTYFRNLTDTNGGTVTMTANWVEQVYEIFNSSNVSQGYAGSLADAMSMVQSNQTIKALKNTIETSNATLASGKIGVKFDLNGKTVDMGENYIENNGTLDIYNSSSTPATLSGSKFDYDGVIVNNGILTTNDTNSSNSLTISYTDGWAPVITNNSGGTLTLKGNTTVVRPTGVYNGEDYQWIIDNSETVNIEGATLTNTYANGLSAGIYNGSTNSRVNMTSGTITTLYVSIFNRSGTGTSTPAVEISGGTITSTNDYGIDSSASGTILVTGGTINANGVAISNSSTGTLTIGDNSNAVSTTTPEINMTGTGVESAIAISLTGAFNFYDGKITSSAGAGHTLNSNADSIVNTPTGYVVSKSTTNGVETAILDNHFTITYNNTGGTGCSTKEIVYGSTYGTVCTPSRTNYTFMGWATEDNLGSPEAATTAGKLLINSGGTVTASVTGYTDANKKWIKASDTNLYAIWANYEILNGSTHVKYVDGLSTAISDASAGYTLKALNNNSSAAVTVDKNLTINTNGKTIEMSSLITNNASCSLTINGNGTITSSGITGISNRGTLTLQNVTLTETATNSTHIYNYGTTTVKSGAILNSKWGINNRTGTVSIQGGTINSENTSIYRSNDTSVAATGAGTITVSSGSINATGASSYAISVATGVAYASTININGGTLSGGYDGIEISPTTTSTSVSMSAGTVIGTRHGIIVKSGSTTISGTAQVTGNTYEALYNDGATVTISGGTFTDADGTMLVNMSGTMSINGGTKHNAGSSVVAVQGGTVNYANSGSPSYTVSGTNGISVSAGTLNFKGGSLEVSSGRGIDITGGAVNVSGGSITTTTNNYPINNDGGTLSISSTPTLTAGSTAVVSTASGTTNITGGTFTVGTSVDCTNGCFGAKAGGGIVNIDGGTYNSPLYVGLGANGTFNFGQNATPSISADRGFWMNGGAINFKKGTLNTSVGHGIATKDDSSISVTTTISGGTINTTASSTYGLYLRTSGSTTISNAKITGKGRAIQASAGNITVGSGAILTGTDLDGIYASGPTNLTISGGSITSTSNDVIEWRSTGSFSMNGGSINTTAAASAQCDGIYITGAASGSVNISGGSINSTNYKAVGSSPAGVSVTISGSATISGNVGVFVGGSTVKIQGGTINAYEYGVQVDGTSASINMSSGTINQSKSGGTRYGSGVFGKDNSSINMTFTMEGGVINATGYGVVAYAGDSATIKSGTITSSGQETTLWNKGTLTVGTSGGTPSTTSPVVKATGTTNDAVYNGGTWNWYDGVLYHKKATTYQPNAAQSGYSSTTATNATYGYQTTLTSSPTYRLSNSSGTTLGQTTTLPLAVTLVPSSGTITALKNNETAGATISKAVTINPNSKTMTLTSEIITNANVTLSGSGTIENGSSNVTQFIQHKSGTLTVSGPTLINSNPNGTVIRAFAGTVKMTSGTITSMAYGIASGSNSTYCSGNTTFTISGGIIGSEGTTNTYGTAIMAGNCSNYTTTLTINGGIFYSYGAGVACNLKCTATISNGTSVPYIEATNNNAIQNYGTITIGSGTTSGSGTKVWIGNKQGGTPFANYGTATLNEGTKVAGGSAYYAYYTDTGKTTYLNGGRYYYQNVAGPSHGSGTVTQITGSTWKESNTTNSWTFNNFSFSTPYQYYRSA